MPDITIAQVVAGVGVLIALGWIIRRLRHAARVLDAIEDIVNRELEHNHGSSMKDDMHGVAVAIGQLQRDRDTDHRAFVRALRLAAKHHPEDAWLYLSLAADERNRS